MAIKLGGPKRRRLRRAGPPMTEGHQAATFSRRALFVVGAQGAVGLMLGD